MKTKMDLISSATFIALGLILAPGCGDKKKNEATPPAAPSAPEQSGEGPDGSSKVETTQSTVLSYWFIRNGCSTEKQTFDSQENLCLGLQDRNRNRNCALDLRQEEFKRVGCPGEFKEDIGAAQSGIQGPSPVRCVGRISGVTGEKKIEQTIPWDRKKSQKIVLSEFSDVKDAGQYSVYLIPNKDAAEPGALEIVGWFIDNNKNQIIHGSLDSGVYFFHRDSNLNGREVEIKCETVNRDLKAPSYEKEAKLEMTCLGTKGPIHGKKDLLAAHFFWDQRTRLSTPLKVLEKRKEVPSDIQVQLRVDKATGLPALRAVSKMIDGHVELVGEVIGRMEMTTKYMSAWDNQDIDFQCAPTKVWNESFKKIAEKQDDGSKK